EDPPEVPMADNRTMAQLLQAPIVGYEDAIVISEIAAKKFKLKHAPAPAPSPTPAPIKEVESNCVTCGGSGTLPGNTITNPKEDLKGITTRSGVAYQGPTIPTTSKVVKQGTEVTKDQVQTPSSQSTAPVQPPVAQTETLVSEPVVAPVSASMPKLKPSIPYPSRRDNERRRDQANEKIEKVYEIFKDMSFEISFTDALILMPKFASTLKALIGNKEKLSEMARTPINEHCSAVILNKLHKKLGDPDKFLIPSNFVVVDFETDPRVPLILGRCYLKTGRALFDVHKGELTLRIGNEAITYNLDQTSRYSANYDQMTANKIEVTDETCEEYSQEVLGFSDVTTSGSPTPSDDPIEANAFLGLEDDPDSPKFNPSYYDPEGDILMLEAILNSDLAPSLSDHEQSNEENELIPTRLVTGWRVCIDYRKLNEATCKDHFPLPFIDQMLERLAGNEYYCFLDGFSGYFQIPIDPRDQKKQRLLALMGRSPTVACLSVCAMRRERFKDKMLQRCEDTKLCLNWEKSHFMVKEGIVLSHKISKNMIEVNKAKVDVITKLPHLTTVKGVRSFLGHAGFYRRFIKDISKISRSMTHLLEKDTPFIFFEIVSKLSRR
nr:DNA-directed DNA polymerase [Tanacetum cinerariifolium]